MQCIFHFPIQMVLVLHRAAHTYSLMVPGSEECHGPLYWSLFNILFCTHDSLACCTQLNLHFKRSYNQYFFMMMQPATSEAFLILMNPQWISIPLLQLPSTSQSFLILRLIVFAIAPASLLSWFTLILSFSSAACWSKTRS